MGGRGRQSCLPPDRLPGEPPPSPAGTGGGSMDAAVPSSPPLHGGLHREEESGSALGLSQRSHRSGTPALPEAPPSCRLNRARVGASQDPVRRCPGEPRPGQPSRLLLGPGAAPTSRREVAGTASGEASPCKLARSGGEQGGFPKSPSLRRGRLGWGRMPAANWAGLGPHARCLAASAAARKRRPSSNGGCPEHLMWRSGSPG